MAVFWNETVILHNSSNASYVKATPNNGCFCIYNATTFYYLMFGCYSEALQTVEQYPNPNRIWQANTYYVSDYDIYYISSSDFPLVDGRDPSFSRNSYTSLVTSYGTQGAALSAIIEALREGPPIPPSVSVPITYYPTGCVLQGPSEAEQGDTVNVLVTPGPGKVIKPESIQVYNRSGLITHTYASGILSFDVPDGQ